MAGTNTTGAAIAAVTWSLAVEEQFYLSLPVIIRFFSGRRLLILVLPGIVLAPILRNVIFFVSPFRWVAAFVLMPCRADALLFGVLAAILLRNEKTRERFRNRGRTFAFVFSLLLPGVAFLMWKSPSLYDPLMQRIGYTWMAFFYATVLVFVLTHGESFLSRLFRNKALRWLGILAYGTYLIHQAVQGFIFALIWGRPPAIDSFYMLLGSVASLVITLLIASLSWRYFESPLIRIGHQLSYQLKVARPSVLVEAGHD
jgi:peptidoglycan/LPS O-acetylase OafA/YrhL